MSARTPKNPNDETVADGEGAEPTPTYEIGYRRPPTHRQFKKGQSGNRNGRPKGRKSVRTFVDRELEKKIPVTVNGRRKLISKAEAIATQHVNKALGGDPKAMQIVLANDRSDEAMAKAAVSAGVSGQRPLKVVDQLVITELVQRIRTAEASAEVATPDAVPHPEAPATPSPATPEPEDHNHD